MTEEEVASKIANINKVEYERIGEVMKAEFACVTYNSNKENFLNIIKKLKAETKVAFILNVDDAEVAKEAVAELKGLNPVVLGATKA